MLGSFLGGARSSNENFLFEVCFGFGAMLLGAAALFALKAYWVNLHVGSSMKKTLPIIGFSFKTQGKAPPS